MHRTVTTAVQTTKYATAIVAQSPSETDGETTATTTTTITTEGETAMKGGEGEMNMTDVGGRRRDDGRRADDDDDRRSRRGGEDRDGERGNSARRSASPRRSRPLSRSGSVSASAPPPEDKAKPNFAPSGLLAAATNTVKNADGTSTLLKYNEPPEARKPLVGWRLYVFKGDEQLGALHLIPLAARASNRIHSFDVSRLCRTATYTSSERVPHRS
jgi:hypothetical protein